MIWFQPATTDTSFLVAAWAAWPPFCSVLFRTRSGCVEWAKAREPASTHGRLLRIFRLWWTRSIRAISSPRVSESNLMKWYFANSMERFRFAMRHPRYVLRAAGREATLADERF